MSKRRHLTGTLLVLAAAWPSAGSGDQAKEIRIPMTTAYQGKSKPIRELASSVDWQALRATVQKSERSNQKLMPLGAGRLTRSLGKAQADADPARQRSHGTSGTSPDIKLSFEGSDDVDNGELTGFLFVPSDTNGDVGREHFVQMNNIVFQIFDKDGSSVLGPLPNNIFFAGTGGGACEIFNDGDPVVLFDQEARRWIFSQFATFFFDGTNFVSHQCFAVSQTEDPTGSYFLYDFAYSPPVFGGFAALNDYPKVGIWPNGYYISANEFEVFPATPTSLTYVGASAGVVDRKAMLAGLPATGVKFYIPFTGAAPIHFSLQPSHWTGRRPPRDARNENIFVQAFDDDTWGNGGGPDGYFHWALSAHFGTSTFSLTPLGFIRSRPYDSNLCDFDVCIPQPAPATDADRLDTLSQFTMFRAAYRNFDLEKRKKKRGHGNDGDDGGGDHETIVVSHSVDADGNDTAGMRWAELRNRGKGFFVHQSGTFAPEDGENRWMGSAAINRRGEIALGYSVSSANTFPSVRVTGRKRRDPRGQMGEEAECHAGTGSQLGSFNRWGDYSSMSADPTDARTFWYVQQYYETSGDFDFKTRICAFVLK
jgi:hypothetical protein